MFDKWSSEAANCKNQSVLVRQISSMRDRMKPKARWSTAMIDGTTL